LNSFRLKKSTREPHNYYPDFLVKVNESLVYVVETKGREDLDDIEKIKRLKVWCDDVIINQKPNFCLSM